MPALLKVPLEPKLKTPFIGGSATAVENAAVNLSLPTFKPALGVMLCAGVLCVLAQPGAWARDGADHERARAAVQAGEVLPLPTLLESLRRTHPGQVLELELEQENGRWIYEVKLLQPDGQLLKLELDAGTGRVRQVQRKPERSADRKKGGTQEDAKADPQADPKAESKPKARDAAK